MDKIRLVIGTVNRLDHFKTEEELEEVYQNSYKPFLTLLNSRQAIRAVAYYSGPLLLWLDKRHPELIMLMKELAQSGKLELLSSGFYEPVFSLIPARDRRSQIELMNNFIRQKTRKRCWGGWLHDSSWEPTLASGLANSGLRYLMLPDSLFLRSGLTADELYRPYITEDQGKTLTLMPVHQRLVQSMGIRSPEAFYKKIASLYTQSPDPIYLNLLVSGELLGAADGEWSDFFTSGWLEKFHEICRENRDIVELNLPHQYYKAMGPRKKIYLQCDTNDRLSGKMLASEQAVLLEMLQRHLHDDGMNNFVQCGFYRQFLSKYREADHIYHKQHHVDLMISHNTSDKERKKAARDYLYKAQRGDIFAHGPVPGIYHNASRKAVYADLLEAEKITRERGTFRQNILQTDYNMDGVDEILFSGQNYNVYISREGGEVLELDYLPARWNYLDTMSRYRESCHLNSAGLSFDDRSPNLFCDFFIRKDQPVEVLNSSSIPDCSNFHSGLHDLETFDREKRIVRLVNRGTLTANGTSSEVSFLKEYRLKKGIELSYEIRNHSDSNLNFQFASLMNFSFAEDSEKVQFSKHKKGTLSELSHGFKHSKNIDGYQIFDKLNSTVIDCQASRSFSLFKEAVFTEVEISGKNWREFQQYALLPVWNVSIRPDAVWKLKISMNLAKK